jgi:hypothetical protein
MRILALLLELPVVLFLACVAGIVAALLVAGAVLRIWITELVTNK